MRCRWPLALIPALAIAGILAAGTEDFQGKRIVSISFDPARQPVNSTDLHAILPLKTGTGLKMQDVRDAIKRLYATGHYLDIQVDAQPEADGVALRFLTKSSWFIGRVFVEGAPPEPPNNGQLVNATSLDLGQPFYGHDVRNAASAISRALENDGYYESTVAPQLEYDQDTHQVHVRFTIESGKRAHFEHARVLGAEGGEGGAVAGKVADATRWKGWFGWQPFTRVRVQRGLERVREYYRKRQRLLASVSVDDLIHDPERRSVQPVLAVDAGPVLDVRVVGAKLSRSKLKRYLPIYEERTVDRDLLLEGKRNLRDHFQGEGYFEVEVEFKEQRVRDGHAYLDYIVNLGNRHRLAYVGIQGNKYFDKETIRERMLLTAKSLSDRRGRYSESLRRRDEENIAALYQSNGFPSVKVSSKVVDDYLGRRGDLGVFMTVEEGPQWLVSKFELQGVDAEQREKIVPLIASGEGQPFSPSNVAIDRDNVLAFFFSNGYPNATFEWSSDPEGPNKVRLLYAVSEGPRQFVRGVLVGGLETTRRKLVDRNLLSVAPGDPLSQISMAETQKRLYDLGVFARVNMAVQNPEGDTQRKYLLYQVEEARKYSIATGFGAELARIGGSQTSFDSPAGKAGFSPRVSFDASRLNLQGLGHTLSFRSRLSTLQRRALLTYTAPRIRNEPGLNLSFSGLFDDSRDVRTFSAKRQEASMQLSQRISRPTTAFYRFSYRRVSVDESTLKINPLLIPLLAQPVRLGILSGNLIRDKRDDPTDAHKGVYSTLDAGIASGIFGSQANFVRLLARNSTYHPIGKKLVLARATTAGWMAAYDFSSDLAVTGGVPLPERFFTGGASSHRGFPENQAGVRDTTTGFPLGGNAVFINNVELRFPLWGSKIGGVLFQDAGNAYSRLRDVSFRARQRDITDFNYMVHSVGFGIRYRTPVGPVRLDFALTPNSPRFFGFEGTREDLLFGRGRETNQRLSRFQFHFSIGQAF